MKFTVCNSTPDPTPKLKVYLDNLRILPAQVKWISDKLNKVKSNQNSI